MKFPSTLYLIIVRRSVVPLFKSRHAALVEGIHEADDPDKAITTHLAIGLGIRVNTLTHTHEGRFEYGDPAMGEEDALYYRVPKSEPCKKYGNTEPCGDCTDLGHTEYGVKTPAGEGRRLLCHNEWTNPVTGEEEYFGLQDACESYFALSGPRVDNDLRHGHEMIDGNGVSSNAAVDWIREIAAKSAVAKDLREDWIRECIDVEEVDPDNPEKRDREQIRDFGTDEEGNGIPDIFTHDLRASYITQLMRNDVPRDKAINKTGHKEPDSMSPYVRFSEKEIDSAEESGYY